MLFRGLDRAHRAWSPAGSIQHKGELCALANGNSSREMPTFRDLRFLPVVTKMRRFTFFANRIAWLSNPKAAPGVLRPRRPFSIKFCRSDLIKKCIRIGTRVRSVPRPERRLCHSPRQARVMSPASSGVDENWLRSRGHCRHKVPRGGTSSARAVRFGRRASGIQP